MVVFYIITPPWKIVLLKPVMIPVQDSQNSTIAFITPTNTMDSENLFSGIVFFIIYFCFALIIMIVFGIWIVRKRRMMKTRKSQESNESVKTDPMSPLISMRNCN